MINIFNYFISLHVNISKKSGQTLKQYIELENGIPSHDTMQRVMGGIAPECIQNVYKKWNELVNSNEGGNTQNNHLY
ncbi:MAG: transposase family protein [Lachnospiraceae bacterium]|nr:transposase family protein [Lachnospiraceae bacterium]